MLLVLFPPSEFNNTVVCICLWRNVLVNKTNGFLDVLMSVQCGCDRQESVRDDQHSKIAQAFISGSFYFPPSIVFSWLEFQSFLALRPSVASLMITSWRLVFCNISRNSEFFFSIQAIVWIFHRHSRVFVVVSLLEGFNYKL